MDEKCGYCGRPLKSGRAALYYCSAYCQRAFLLSLVHDPRWDDAYAPEPPPHLAKPVQATLRLRPPPPPPPMPSTPSGRLYRFQGEGS